MKGTGRIAEGGREGRRGGDLPDQCQTASIASAHGGWQNAPAAGGKMPPPVLVTAVTDQWVRLPA